MDMAQNKKWYVKRFYIPEKPCKINLGAVWEIAI
jgi:hypothetical protein